jgi:hypothetical protein
MQHYTAQSASSGFDCGINREALSAGYAVFSWIILCIWTHFIGGGRPAFIQYGLNTQLAHLYLHL